jgi:hypothetical protein
MKSYKFLPTAVCEFDDNVSIHQGQTESEEHSVIIIKKTGARELALSICPELAHLEGALLAEQELNNQLKEEIERLKGLSDKIKTILKGIDQVESESKDGWWETSYGADFGAKKLNEILEQLISK